VLHDFTKVNVIHHLPKLGQTLTKDNDTLKSELQFVQQGNHAHKQHLFPNHSLTARL